MQPKRLPNFSHNRLLTLQEIAVNCFRYDLYKRTNCGE